MDEEKLIACNKIQQTNFMPAGPLETKGICSHM